MSSIKVEDCSSSSMEINENFSSLELDLDDEDRVKGDEIICARESWLAVKPIIDQREKKELINIVSLSIEFEKIIVVSREHNRKATDDQNTNKQWYGIYTVEKFYTLHEQIRQIDSGLDTLYPNELRPIKGYLYTYFCTDLARVVRRLDKSLTSKQQIDLHDNPLCRTLQFYLKQAYESLGLNLYTDILFNDLKTDDYFEIYSELNLKRLQAEIDQLKAKILALLDKPQQLHSNDKQTVSTTKSRLLLQSLRINKSMAASTSSQNVFEMSKEDEIRFLRMNIKLLLDLYINEDSASFDLVKLYAEYYNNMLKPLTDARDIAKVNKAKFERKVINQERTNRFIKSQTSLKALDELKSQLAKANTDLNDLSNDIDAINVQHKQNIIDLHSKVLGKMINKDKTKFIQSSKNASFPLLFDYLTKERQERLEREIVDKSMQMCQSQISLLERDKRIDNQKDILRLKLQLCNLEEKLLKEELDKYKRENQPTNATDPNIKYYGLKQVLLDLGDEYLQEVRDKYKLDFELILNHQSDEVKNNEIDNDDDDDDYLNEDSKFFDTYQDTESMLEEEARARQLVIDHMNQIKKKILTVSSKRSALRLTLNKIMETEKQAKEQAEIKEPEEETLTVKTTAERREEDNLQKELCMEHRKKALQRLREYKMKNFKETASPIEPSPVSLNTSITLSNKKTVIKKPYVPKSKQRILPPTQIKKKPAVVTPSLEQSVVDKKSAVSFEIKLDDTSKSPSIPSMVPMAPPPPPPPMPDFFGSTISQCIAPSIPPPPPPPPLFFQATPEPVIKAPPPPPPVATPLKTIEKNVTEFDINEIKTFKFKKRSNSKISSDNQARSEPLPNNVTNSWSSLMNEIKTGRKLRNVSTTSEEGTTESAAKRKSSSHNKQLPSSKLELDLNAILTQRSKFFSLADDEDDDDDENGSLSDSSWNTSTN